MPTSARTAGPPMPRRRPYATPSTINMTSILATSPRFGVVAAGPDRNRIVRAARPLQVLGSGVRLWGRPLDYYRRHRRGGSRSGLERRALPAVRIERRRRLRGQAALRHAKKEE